MTLQFNYVRKIDGNGNKSINLALPYEAYTVGDDRHRSRAATTSPARPTISTLPVYSVPRTYPTFGQNIERIVQADGNNRYHAMGVTLNKQYVEQLLVPGRRSTPTIATCATTRRAIRTRRCTARGTATPATTTACRTSSSRRRRGTTRCA